MTYIKINGELITQAGLIALIIHETPTRVTVEVTALFFPVHATRWGPSQVNADTQEYLRDLIIGQHHVFWKAGTRANFEVGGNRIVVDWDYTA